MKKYLFFKLLVSVLLVLTVGSLAGMFTAQAIPEWYESINRPSFSPPNYLFGPVWTILYMLMGISLFLIWKEPTSKKRNLAMLVFLLQLVLNFSWSILFFSFGRIGLALVEIILLWFNIVLMVVMFYRIKPLAAYINIPYLLWVTFATILNASFYLLN
jgi:tryptophan-rich sensory protein